MSGEAIARGARKTRKGIVISRSGDKSIAVQVERRLPHPLYGKVIRALKKYHAHDERNEARIGDTVLIAECRPISRIKRWRLVSVGTSHEGARQS